MATGYKVTPQQLVSTADALEELRARYREQISSLSDKQQELRGMWEGEANEAFNTSFGQGMESHRSFDNVLQQYTQTLRSAASMYAKAEQQAADVARTRTF